MLQSKLTYTQVGVFSMAATPYSLKLLWSPIVDSCFRCGILCGISCGILPFMFMYLSLTNHFKHLLALQGMCLFPLQ